jgi:hypothetical protein
MKRPFLAMYDCGQGGIWAYVRAESADDIEVAFDAHVVDELPSWLNGERPGVITIDIDDRPPSALPRR